MRGAAQWLTAKHGDGDVSRLPQDIIDIDVFEQLLEMDEEEDREFSQSLVWNYFEQAESTFDKMDAALFVPRVYLLTGSGRRRTCRNCPHWGTS